MGAEESIQEFYERDFEDEEYIYEWYKELIEQIKTGELETENVIGLVDVMFTKDHTFFLSKRSLQEIERIMDMGENQSRQIIYLFSKIISIYITEFPEEEQLGLIIGSVIEINSKKLLKAIMLQAEEDGELEVLREHLTDVITDIDVEDERMKENIRRWYREHEFHIPSSFVEEDRPLQISSLTPPHERVRRGGWFGKFKR